MGEQRFAVVTSVGGANVRRWRHMSHIRVVAWEIDCAADSEARSRLIRS